MFEQSGKEQIETLVHELGHVFGLRHFFALLTEGQWPAIVYGEHKKFSIMNYGEDSKLTDADKNDLARLYKSVWHKQIIALIGTPIRTLTPYSARYLYVSNGG